MSIREKLAIYGPNKRKWSVQVYEAIEHSGVKWVVWRTDADPEAPMRLEHMEIKVIVQGVDRFNLSPWVNPIELAESHWQLLNRVVPPGSEICWDNEPQLDPKRAGRWFAENWTRYCRSYMAHWRWMDHGGRHPLILPALAVGWDRNGAVWHQVQEENLREAEGVAHHAYWQDPSDRWTKQFGDPLNLLPTEDGRYNNYILEFGSTALGRRHDDHLVDYEEWLRALPDSVRVAALFILDPTDDWQELAITDAVLNWFHNLAD